MSGPAKTPVILIVDDEEDFRAILKVVLERAGYTVFQAPNGTEGLKQFSSIRPDLLIVDLSMPDMDGIEVTRRIRTQGSGVPILMLTVRSQILTVSEGLAAGVTDYVLKPFDKDDLLKRVERGLKSA